MKKTIYLTILGIITIAGIIYGVHKHTGSSNPFKFVERPFHFNFHDADKDDFMEERGEFSDEITLESASEINIEVQIMDIRIEKGEENKLSYDCNRKTLTPIVNVKDGKIDVAQEKPSFKFNTGNSKCKLILTVTSEDMIKDLTIKGDICQVVVENLNIENLELHNDVGNIFMKDVGFEDATIDSDVGNIELENVKDLDNMSVRISSDIGNIRYLGKRHARKYRQDADSNKKLNITTDVGNIEVSK